MFQPVFVFDSNNPSEHAATAVRKGFRMVDIRDPEITLSGNIFPAIIIWDAGVNRAMNEVSHGAVRFAEIRYVGSIHLLRRRNTGHVQAVHNPFGVIAWFFDATPEQVRYDKKRGFFTVRQAVKENGHG